MNEVVQLPLLQTPGVSLSPSRRAPGRAQRTPCRPPNPSPKGNVWQTAQNMGPPRLGISNILRKQKEVEGYWTLLPEKNEIIFVADRGVMKAGAEP